MAEAKVIFSLENIEITIDCSIEEKIKDIVLRFSKEIKRNFDSFIFIYEGAEINLNLSFKNHATSKDLNNKNLIIFVYEKNIANYNYKYPLTKEYYKNSIIVKIDIDSYNTNKDIILFNLNQNDKINVYLNNEKVNKSMKYNKWIYNFTRLGKYIYQINFVNNLTNMKGFFEKCFNIISIDLSHFDSSCVEDMSSMFKECYKLKEIKGLYNFKTNTVKTMESMFQSCISLQYLDLSSLDTSNVTDMKDMFNKCYNLKEIKGLNNFRTSNVKSMAAMFQYCQKIENLDLFTFNTANVTDMSFMFNECNKLKEIKGLDNLDTKKVTYMTALFQSCSELIFLDLSSFETFNVIDMMCMFNGCEKLKEIKGLNNLDTKKVIKMSALFQRCKEIKYLDISNFDTSNVTNMEFMFNECKNLKEIKGFNKCNTNKVIKMTAMFQGCKELKNLDLSNFDTSKVINMENIFNKCDKLEKLKYLYNFIPNQLSNILKLVYSPKKKLKIKENNFYNKQNYKIRLFSKNFVKINKGKSKIIYKNKIFELSEYLENIDANYNYKDLVKIKLIFINNIIDMSYIFNDCDSLLSVSGYIEKISQKFFIEKNDGNFNE